MNPGLNTILSVRRSRCVALCQLNAAGAQEWMDSSDVPRSSHPPRRLSHWTGQEDEADPNDDYDYRGCAYCLLVSVRNAGCAEYSVGIRAVIRRLICSLVSMISSKTWCRRQICTRIRVILTSVT